MTGERWDVTNANKSFGFSTQQEHLYHFSFHKRYNQNELQAVYIYCKMTGMHSCMPSHHEHMISYSKCNRN